MCDVETGFVCKMSPNGCLEKHMTCNIALSLVGMLPGSTPELPNNCAIAMDNCFTWAKEMTVLSENGIGVNRTMRRECRWPPKEIWNVVNEWFNALCTLNDKGEFLIGRWVDNDIVNLVSDVHTGHEKMAQMQKLSLKTNTNRKNTEQVWGSAPIKEVHIPSIIDDCNHWTLWVDEANQLILHCHPKICYRQTWTSLMFHALDVARTKRFIVAKQLG